MSFAACPLKGFTCPPGAKHGLLDHVLGVVHRPQHPVAMNLQLSSIALGQGGKGHLVAGTHGGGGLLSQGRLCNRTHSRTTPKLSPTFLDLI